jgi:hypothetical protein
MPPDREPTPSARPGGAAGSARPLPPNFEDPLAALQFDDVVPPPSAPPPSAPPPFHDPADVLDFEEDVPAPVVVRHPSLAPAATPAPALAGNDGSVAPGEAKLRFTDTRLFIEFLKGPFTRRTLDLRLAERHERGASMWIVLQVDGLRDPIRLRSRIQEHLPDGRTRIVLASDPGLQAWLGGFVTAWQLGLETPSVAASPERSGDEAPRRTGPLPPLASDTRPIDPKRLAERLDHLTYYELLGVAAEAPPDDVQQAFHVLSRAYHPDLFHGRSRPEVSLVNSLFRRINEAYSVLRVAARRRAYDEGLVGPRAQWRLRWREDDDASRRRSMAGLDPRERGEHYWSRAVALLDRNSATRTDVAATTVRMLRTAVAFEPDQKEYSQLLDDIVTGRPLHRRRTGGGRPAR